MRKILTFLIAIILCGMTVMAETYWYKANSYAYKSVSPYTGQWTEWSSWTSCDVDLKIDVDNDLIVIYSNSTQAYKVVEYDGTDSDGQGGSYMQFKVVDQDFDRGTVRLRIEKNGNSQIYVDFLNVMWVYNVRKY